MNDKTQTIVSGVVTSVGVVLMLIPPTVFVGFFLICFGWALVAF